MKDKTTTHLLHVLLFAVYPVLAMLAFNVGEAQPSDALRAMAFAVILGAVTLLVFRLLLRDWARAGLAATGLLVLFYSYGHIYSLLKTLEIAGFSPGKHSLMLPAYALLAVAWIWWVGRRLSNPDGLARFLNVVGLVLLAFSLYPIVEYEIAAARYPQRKTAQNAQTVVQSGGEKPDIYYIILDGYARSDVLQELYDYDNSAFLQALEERGFYIAEQSTANYNQTALSLASSLNMKYVNYLTEEMGADNKKRLPLVALIRESELRSVLDAQGYEVIAFETGYEISEMRGADELWSLNSEVVPTVTALWRFNGFEALLLESTAMRAVFDLHFLSPDSLRRITLDPEYQAHRERVLYTLDRLDDPASMPGNYLVFAHIINPHPPFVFDAEGKAITPDGAYVIADGDEYPGNDADYIEGYRGQVSFISGQILAVIDRILEKSETPPVIVLQADHGPGSQLVWDSPQESNLTERFGILNAYYLSGGDPSGLYPSITPVNTFRVVLDRFFGGSYEPLDDQNYFAPWLRPYEFHEITEELHP